MRRRGTAILLAVVAVAAIAVVLLARGGGDEGPRRLAPGRGSTAATRDPLAYDGGRRAEFEARAAAGLADVLYAKSPGGVPATARRVARLRPLVEAAARRGGIDPDVLEAIVFLESAGRPSARASDDLTGAVGLTQILAQTGSGLLGMHVDVAASERLTRSLQRATSPRRIRALQARRRRVDQRFDPRAALAGTVRYLRFAQSRLHRDDLAVVSYHMGVGNLQRALRAYGTQEVPYAQLFFDSTPLRHAAAWRILASLGDDSSTYLWRVRAAQAIMAAWRDDPRAVERQALLHGQGAEVALRPPDTTPRLAPGALVEIHGFPAVRPSRALAAGPAAQRALAPAAAALLRYMGIGVRDVSRTGPLVVTGAWSPAPLPAPDATGQAFAISRAYRTGAQAQALQFWLDRLTALDVLAWSRGPTDIHVVAGPRAEELVPLLGNAAS